MHILIDFETLGSARDGRIAFAAFGLFPIDQVESQEDIASRITEVKLDWTHPEQESYLADDRTLQWWRKQPIEIRQRMLMDPETGSSVTEFLNTFEDAMHAWQFNAKTDAVWARGTDFDITILHRFYSDLGREPPFPFHKVRDVRTFLDAVNVLHGQRPNGSQFQGKIPHLNQGVSSHHAAEDVANDIHNLQIAYEALSGL